MPSYLKSNQSLFFLLVALLLFVPAFFINLEDQPIIEDEAIRALVGFEMYQSGDYITPTIGGEPYLRKPPLYNWLVAGSFALFGNYSETAVRFPMLLSLLAFSLSIFFMVRKQFGNHMATLNALIFLTLGRIILFESLHGLIDISFSWLTYLFFYSSYFLFQKKKFLQLFLLAYVLTTLTFLMKGLPALLFTATTLLVLFISERRFRMLINWRHFIGMAIFLGLTGMYYLFYFNINEISPEQLFTTLFEQSSRRTVLRYGLWDSVKHIFVFPVDMLYHFLPWTLLSICLLTKGLWKKVWAHPFLKYNILVLLFNIIPYWTSPEVFPRYILMLVPLYFVVVSYAYFEAKNNSQLFSKIIEYAFGIVLTGFVAAPFTTFLFEVFEVVNYLVITSIVLSALLALLTFFYWKAKDNKLLWFATALLVLRIGFNFLVLPTRQHNSDEVLMKETAIELADDLKGETIHTYWNTEEEFDYFYIHDVLRYRFHFQFSAALDQIVYNKTEKLCGPLIIAKPEHIRNDSIVPIGWFEQKIDNTPPLRIFRFVCEN